MTNLSYISEIIGILAQLYLQTVMLFLVCKKSIVTNLKKFVLVFSITTVGYTMGFFLRNTELEDLKPLFLLVPLFFCCIFIFKDNFINAFFHSFSIIILFSFVEVFSVLSLKLVLRLSFEELLVSPVITELGPLVATIFSFAFVLLYYGLLARKIAFSNIQEEKRKELSIIYGVTLVFVVLKLMSIISSDYKANTYLIISGCFESLLLIYLMVQYIYIKTLKSNLKDELTSAKLANDNLNKSLDTLRGFKHDLNNAVTVIQGYLAVKDLEGLQEFLEDGILKDLEDIKYVSTTSPNKIQSPGIYNLAMNKCIHARRLGIKVKSDVTTVLTKADLKNEAFKITRILGILLDNAIEGAVSSEIKDPLIYIELSKVYGTDKKLLTITNSFNSSNKEITIENCFKKNFSTKKKKSGFGLYEVNKFVKNTDFLSLETVIKKNKFTQILTISSCEEDKTI